MSNSRQRYLLFLPREELMAAREALYPCPVHRLWPGGLCQPLPQPSSQPLSFAPLPVLAPARNAFVGRVTKNAWQKGCTCTRDALRWCSGRKRESRGVDHGEGSQDVLALAPLFLHQTHTRTNKHPTRSWPGKLFFPVRIITATPVTTTRVCSLLPAYNSVILQLSGY